MLYYIKIGDNKDMTISKIKCIMFMVVLGFLFLATDIYFITEMNYPKPYQNDKDIIGEYQYYNIKTFYGATCTLKKLDQTVPSDSETSTGYYTDAEFVDDVFFQGVRIDIFSDMVGFVLIAIACLLLAKYKFLFRPAFLFAIISIVLKLALTAFPFFFNGMFLCNISLGTGIAYMASTILTTFFTTKGFLSLIRDTCCRDERLWLNTSWFISVVLMILVLLLTWLDLSDMAFFFMIVLVLDIIVYGLVLRRVDEFAARNCNGVIFLSNIKRRRVFDVIPVAFYVLRILINIYMYSSNKYSSMNLLLIYRSSFQPFYLLLHIHNISDLPVMLSF